MTLRLDRTVAGESLVLLIEALRCVEMDQRPDGSADVSFEVPPEPGAAMHRAIMRIEAELLLDDADALEVGRREGRTADQRRHDAFVLLAVRVGEAVTNRTVA